MHYMLDSDQLQIILLVLFDFQEESGPLSIPSPGLWVSADTACMLQGLSGPRGAQRPSARGRHAQLPGRFGQEGAAAPAALPKL